MEIARIAVKFEFIEEHTRATGSFIGAACGGRFTAPVSEYLYDARFGMQSLRLCVKHHIEVEEAARRIAEDFA